MTASMAIPGRCLWALSLVVQLAACSEGEPHVGADEIEHAERVYVDCVENEIGMEVAELRITSSGDITVRFGEGYTEERAELAIRICEARIASVLDPGSGLPVLGPPPNLGRPGSDQELREFVAERVELGFEGVILAESDGKLRMHAGFGALKPGAQRSPDADTAFDCGSIMKVVTAATVFLLEQDGALSRDDTLGEVLQDVPDRWRDVTLQEVLTHSAGFHAYHDTQGDFEAMDRATALGAILDQEPLFPPGSASDYSNSGYTLLAIVIEDVTGLGYADVIRARVFEPLGMSRSGLYGDGLWVDANVAVGRGADEHHGNDPSVWSAPTWALIGNGGLVSTANDLLALAKGFGTEALFEPETREAFMAEYLGRSPGRIGAVQVLGYAGANDFGFNALVVQVPQDRTFVVSASHVFAPITAEILGLEALQVIYGDTLELPEPD